MSESETLLAKAKSVYQSASSLYCAKLLECGRLLHDFILAHLKNGDGMIEVDRIKAGYTREKATEMAAASFGADRDEIKIILRAAMTAALLSADGNCGLMAHSAVSRFARLIKRKTVGVDNSHFGRGGDFTISDSEEWIIKPGLEVKAKQLFARAVAERWSQIRCESETKQLLGKSETHRIAKPPDSFTKEHRSYSNDEDDEPSEVEINPAVASPGDVADYCLGIIQKASDPWAVAQRLIAELSKIQKPRMRMAS